ncbi:NifB/NifX family molybdenum-iron cluster-binding protein [uncultured Ilyobacter sp.]|uniref:NifB/NifX family molybdenum-iron cluster-binding protein n=1 Tax=uncultured Ilyobacter sp. TaxID=544433 RepID=UPI0029F51420|nr:NifB/NifX family molybdenum-iron cluster-binding protein [uncultured Ilyobacter sp.]
MKVAVSVNDSGMVSSHLGKSKIFLVFSKVGNEVAFLERRVTDGNHTNHIIEDIDDCDAVISGKIGDGMVESLKKINIKAIVEENIADPLEAVEKMRV